MLIEQIFHLFLSFFSSSQQATADLQEAYKNPESIPALCELVVKSEDASVRQYSAQLLKKRLGKLRNWNGVHPDHQNL